MTRASRARGITRAAAYGGGGLVGAGGAFFGILVAQAQLARRRIGPAVDPPLTADGRYLPDGTVLPPTAAQPGEGVVRLAVLGDSGAAGFGVDHPGETTGAVLAAAVAAEGGRAVDYRCFAVVGARTSDLTPQLEASEVFHADVAVIVVGANDVTHAVKPGTSVRLLADAVSALRQRGTQVVVGTCPDLGTVRPIPHPLRAVARSWSRSLAAAQSMAVVEAGGRSVALADLLGPEFEHSPETYFGPDHFHPSATGYRELALATVPSVLEVLGLAPSRDGEAEPPAQEASLAAAEAADHAGAELSATTVDGQELGRAGRRWVRLRRRTATVTPGAAAPGS